MAGLSPDAQLMPTVLDIAALAEDAADHWPDSEATSRAEKDRQSELGPLDGGQRAAQNQELHLEA